MSRDSLRRWSLWTASSGNAEVAIDRDLTSFWVSNSDEEAWLCVELREPEPVRAVYTLWKAEIPEVGKVQVSMDGEHWQDVGSFDYGFPDMPLVCAMRASAGGTLCPPCMPEAVCETVARHR